MSKYDAMDTEVRYCKKCGCELASINKRKICDNCRRESAGNRRKAGLTVGMGIGSLLLLVITKGKFGKGGLKL